MQISDFDYHLPTDLIAQEPAASREGSRMLVVNRQAGSLGDEEFASFPNCLDPSDVLVLNNTRVFPARLLGLSETGGHAEIFLISQLNGNVWEALARPARRLKAGKKVAFGESLTGRIVEPLAEGRVRIEFEFEGNFDAVLDEVGRTPLPPYISRETEHTYSSDRERYQTVYAKHRGAIAAPTAGLHFTPEVLESIRANGVVTTELTLHVGYGTFEPVRAADLSRHSVMAERYDISPDTAKILNDARREGRRIVAVGTTTTRALEAGLATHDEFVAGKSLADLTITPGYRFKAVGAMLTNFHLPQSSLLILVSTFGGHKLIMDSYRHAVTSRYRFYSYGDCMFIT